MTPTTRRDLVACGVDVGSTNTKVVAMAPDGRPVARSHRPTPRDPRDLTIDALILRDSIEEMLLQVCGETRAVAAVAVVGIGEDGVLVDAAGRPLARALAWFDPRRVPLLAELGPKLGVAAGGLPVRTDAARTVVGWHWARQQPGAGAARSWLALSDYASACWADRPFMSDTLAARTAAWSPARRTWIRPRVEAALGDEELLPEVVSSGEVVGQMRSTRLSDAGVLAEGALVIAGGHDHPVAGWALDRVVPGAVLDSMGTAEVVVAQSSRPVPAELNGLDVASGIRQPGTTLLCVQELARNMRWASQDIEVGKALLAIIAGDLEPDSGLTSGAFVPGTSGGGQPYWTPCVPTSPVGRASAVVGALAVLGELAVTRVIAEAGGAGEVYASGGWSRSRGWRSVKEAVTSRAMRVIPEPEVTAVGAALLAAEGLGWTPHHARALALAGQEYPASAARRD